MSHLQHADDDDFDLQPLVFPSRRSMPSMNGHSMFRLQRRGSHSMQNPFADPRQRSALFKSYAPDWFLTISLAAIFVALDRVSGFKREFSLDDTSLQHPFTVHERVPDFALYIICFIAPLCLLPLINYLTVQSYWDLHNSTLGLVLGLALTGAITEITKLTVGRPRPDLISRCIPRPDSVDPKWGLSSVEICTQTDRYMLNDGFRSFPSGHSSLSFAGLGFLSFYLAGKLHLFDKQGHAPKAWLALTPLSGAALVAISRTMDYRHHWQDVLTGSILGLVLSYFSYRQYYPSLASEVSHRPYAPRISHEGPVLPMHRPANSAASQESIGQHANGNEQYHDSDEEGVPHGTVPRPERTDIANIWKDGDDLEEVVTHA